MVTPVDDELAYLISRRAQTNFLYTPMLEVSRTPWVD
jgi:hypothetical protein